MVELVHNNNGKIVTTSLLVAQKFEKEHKHVLDAIKELFVKAENSVETENEVITNLNQMFILSEYEIPLNNGTNAVRKAPMYLISRDGFSLLVMGFTGQKALQFKLDFINAFNKMEQMIKSKTIDFSDPDTVLMLAQNWKEEKDKRIQAEKQLQAQAPKVLFTDAVIGSQSSCLIGELAKIITQNGYEIGEKRLFKWLRENHYLGQKGERYNIPNQQYIEQGLFELKKGTRSGNNGVMHTTITPKITGKGQVYFVNKFLGK